MIGTPEELGKLAATGCSHIIDCKNISAVSLINIINACKGSGGTITLANIKSKSLEALLEIAVAGKDSVVLDTR